MRDHLRIAGKLADDDGRGPPEGTAYLWTWFAELSQARTSSGFGANPLSYSELDAWARLTGSAPHPWEIRAIRDLDTLYLNISAKQD